MSSTKVLCYCGHLQKWHSHFGLYGKYCTICLNTYEKNPFKDAKNIPVYHEYKTDNLKYLEKLVGRQD